MKKTRMLFESPADNPQEEYVNISIPKSTYDLFGAVLDHPITGATDEYRRYLRESSVINEDIYPFTEIFEDKGSPKGTVVSGILPDSKFYPGIAHPYWIYIPAQYNASEPANLIVIYDGKFFMDENESKRRLKGKSITILFDNLISEGKLPVSIVLFAGYGVPGPGQPICGFEEGEINRSYEYDRTSDWNSRFLTEELMPAVLADYNISADPQDHAICGMSSSGIAAFSTAWFKPEYFGKVYIGSATFANIRNGIIWPYAIRICEKKPLQIFASVGRHDIDNFYGNWLNSNYDVGCALQFRGYKHKLYITEGGHSIRLFLRFLPEGLEWLINGTEPEMSHCELAEYSEILR